MYDIDEVCKKYYSVVYKYLISLCRDVDLSEELTQETFYIAIKNIDRFKGKCTISTWLCIIAKHLYYRKIKEIKRISINELNEKDIQEVSIEENFINRKKSIELYKKLQCLDENTKNIIYLRLLGFSFKEIADITGKNETWCKVVYHRGKNKLGKLLKGGKNNESEGNV